MAKSSKVEKNDSGSNFFGSFLIILIVGGLFAAVGLSFTLGAPFDWRPSASTVVLPNGDPTTPQVVAPELMSVEQPAITIPEPPPMTGGSGTVPSQGTISVDAAQVGGGVPEYVHPNASGQPAGWTDPDTGGLSLGENVPLVDPNSAEQFQLETENGSYTITVYDPIGQNPALVGDGGGAGQQPPTTNPPATNILVSGQLVSQGGVGLGYMNVSIGTNQIQTGSGGAFMFSVAQNGEYLLFYNGAAGGKCFGGQTRTSTSNFNTVVAVEIPCP